MSPRAFVTHVPTLTGAKGLKDLARFYQDYFSSGHPPSMRMRLISRTCGVDQVVDEMWLSFKHTIEMPWLLPGVPPTDKEVQMALVSVVCLRGEKVAHERVYWDQASVLVQLGLLDPSLVPGSMKGSGVKKLPVVGAESAKKVLDEDSVPSNQLIDDW